MLKSYQQFLNENKANDEELEQFFDTIALYIYKNGFKHTSYSNIAAYGKEMTSQETKKIDRIVQSLDEKIDNAKIKKLLNGKAHVKVSNYFDGRNRFKMQENGLMDIIINHFHDDWPLSGLEITDDYDTLIRYLYGWHHTKYGMKAILQNFNDIKKYYKWVVDGLSEAKDIYLIEEIINNDIFIVKGSLDNLSGYISSDSDIITKIESSNANYYLYLMSFPDMKYTKVDDDKKLVMRKKDLEPLKYIADQLVIYGKEGYFSVFGDKLPTDHLDDERIDQLKNLPKTMNKFNI